MSNELDSNQTDGTPAQPNAGGSEGGVSGGSFDPKKLQEALTTFSKRLEEIDSRTKSLQGDKDRGVNKTRKELEEVKRQIAEIEALKKRGLSEEEAIEEYDFRQTVRQLREQPAAPVGSETVDVGKVIAEYGLDLSNPEVKLAFENKQFKSDVEVKAVVADLMKPKPTPTQAQTPAKPAEKLSSADGNLQKAYEKDLEALRKVGRPNPAQISDLKAQYRKKGLEVW